MGGEAVRAADRADSMVWCSRHFREQPPFFTRAKNHWISWHSPFNQCHLALQTCKFTFLHLPIMVTLKVIMELPRELLVMHLYKPLSWEKRAFVRVTLAESVENCRRGLEVGRMTVPLWYHTRVMREPRKVIFSKQEEGSTKEEWREKDV